MYKPYSTEVPYGNRMKQMKPLPPPTSLSRVTDVPIGTRLAASSCDPTDGSLVDRTVLGGFPSLVTQTCFVGHYSSLIL